MILPSNFCATAFSFFSLTVYYWAGVVTTLRASRPAPSAGGKDRAATRYGAPAMKEKRRNLLVGLFVLLGLGALGTLVVLFGREGMTWFARSRAYPLHIQFQWVSGIREGTLVQINGIAIGRVTHVDLADRQRFEAGVDVVVSIDNDYKIPLGSKARTTEPMFGSGRPPIDILPGTAAGYLAPNATIPGEVRRGFESVFPPGIIVTFENTARQIGGAAEALTPVLKELEDLLAKRSPAEVDVAGGPQGNLSTAMARLDASLRHFNDVLGDEKVKSQLRDTIANVQDMSAKGKAAMADVQTAAADSRELIADGRKLVAKADQTLTNLDGRVNDLARATTDGLDRADQFLDYLNVIGRQVTSGQGNLGQLVMDNKLYEALRVSAERLSLAVEEFRALVAEIQEKGLRTRL
jgi:ABC-type transporter Mla subunit MlaD